MQKNYTLLQGAVWIHKDKEIFNQVWPVLAAASIAAIRQQEIREIKLL